MFERYTERARRVIFFARYEASNFGSTSIEADHMLLGLLREDKNVISRYLNVSAESIRDEVAKQLPIKPKVATSIDLPLSHEGRNILRFSLEEADKMGHKYVAVEHLLLGILLEENCSPARILRGHGLDSSVVRETLMKAPPSEDPETLSGTLKRLLSRQFPFFTALQQNPNLPKSGVVADGDTAMRIAEAAWLPIYGAETVAAQKPFSVELKFNVWLVTGAAAPDTALFVFILQADGRILSLGQGKSGLPGA
jgi:hypothetical protein